VSGVYLDGAAWAEWGAGLHAYIAGDPAEITVRTVTLWDPENGVALGDPVAFIVDELTTNLEAVEAGTLDDVELVIYTTAPLTAGATYRYASNDYTAEEAEADETNTPDATFPCRTMLRRFAK
jgi:hypothetical protein